MNTDRLLDQIVSALREQSVPEFHQPLPTFVVDLAREAQSRSAARPRSIPGRARRRFGIAGATLAALLALVVASATITPEARQSTAFAEVQKAAAASRSVKYRVLSFHGKKDPYVATVTAVRGLGSYSEASGGLESITDLPARRMLAINHRTRKAILYQLYRDDDGWAMDKFHEKLQSIPASAEPLGPAKLDGKEALQFQLSSKGRYVAWVDPKTKLPLRMELTLDGAQPGGTPFHEVITDSLFDAAVDETRFEPKVPEGYTVQRCEEDRNRQPLDMKAMAVSPIRGIGPLRLGASKEQIIGTFGRPDCVEPEGRSPVAASAPGKPADANHAKVSFEKHIYYSLGFELRVSSAQGVTHIRCFELEPIARPFLGKTAAGIALGASIEEVVGAYGVPERRSGLRDEVLDYFHKGWSFVFAEGKLSSFTASEPMSDQIEIEVHRDGSYTERVKAETRQK